MSEGAPSWQLPAGAVEAGESSQQAAVRETLEETGLVVASTQILGERVHPLRPRHDLRRLPGCLRRGRRR